MNQELYEKQLIEKLKKNRHVISFLKKNQLSESFVEMNSDYFASWLQTLK